MILAGREALHITPYQMLQKNPGIHLTSTVGHYSKKIHFINIRQQLENRRITRHKARLTFCREIIEIKVIF